MKWTWTLTITKALVATVVFGVLWLISFSSLPSCNSVQGGIAAINGQKCLVRQSYLHDALGWLALASLITAIVLFVRKKQAQEAGKKKGGASGGGTR
jgi:hypothetical protein